jgi:hypothetical protein
MTGAISKPRARLLDVLRGDLAPPSSSRPFAQAATTRVHGVPGGSGGATPSLCPIDPVS